MWSSRKVKGTDLQILEMDSEREVFNDGPCKSERIGDLMRVTIDTTEIKSFSQRMSEDKIDNG